MLSYGHIGIWEHMSVDSDEEWIREGITNETLVIAHDGYYMSTESTTLYAQLVLWYYAQQQNSG